jgi:hypothetical protein
VRAVAETISQRFQDQVTLDFRHGAADEIARDLLGGHSRLCRNISSTRLVEPCAIRRKDAVNAYFGPGRQQHCTM